MADSLLRRAIRKHFDFKDVLVPPDTAGASFWTKSETGDATVTIDSNGANLALTNASEAQRATLLNGDILVFDVDDLIRLEGLIKLSTDELAAGIDAAVGLAGADNATLDNIAANCWLRCAGSNAVVLETDDGVTDVDDIASGLTLADEWRRFAIDFSVGVHSQGPPARSAGGKASVRFFLENNQGQLMPVGQDQHFSLAAYSGGLQLFATIRKASGTALATLYVKNLTVDYRG